MESIRLDITKAWVTQNTTHYAIFHEVDYQRRYMQLRIAGFFAYWILINNCVIKWLSWLVYLKEFSFWRNCNTNKSFNILCSPTRLSELSRSWLSTRSKTDLCLSGSDLELVTRSDTMLRESTGEEESCIYELVAIC